MAHLTTDAHELNKLSFPFLCLLPRPSSSPPAEAFSHYIGGRKMAGGEVFFLKTAYVNYIVVKDT